MSRALFPAFLLLAIAGCQLPPEQVPLKPLPEDGPPQAYADIVTRIRVQATAANEAFYINKWDELEDAARGLEKTAAYINKAPDLPTGRRAAMAAEAAGLIKESQELRDAAKAQDVRQANEILQRVNLKVRELRP
jgi:hypothetical protein